MDKEHGSKGMMAALDVKEKQIRKMPVEMFKQLNEKGLAFTTNHAVTKMFKEINGEAYYG